MTAVTFSLPVLTDRFQTDLAATVARLRQGLGGVEGALGLSDSLDRLLIGLSGRAPEVTLVAIGGSGRRERSLGSDVDLLVLCDDVLEAAPQRIVHPLYDLGLEVGLTVRTVEDCLALYDAGDFDSWAALLEARYLAGPRDRFDRLVTAMRRMIATGDATPFLRTTLAGRDERRRRAESASDPGEPNLKSAPGGLRDLNTLIWCFWATDPAMLDDAPSRTGTDSLLARLVSSGRLTAAEGALLADAHRFLLAARLALHDLSPTAGDTLTRAVQPAVAARLGLGSADATGAETLMRAYLRHARTVGRLGRRLLASAEAQVARCDRPGESRPLDGPFALQTGFLSLTGQSVSTLPILLGAVRLQAALDAPLDPSLLRPSAPLDRPDGPDLSLFRAILAEPHVGRALRTLDDLDLLGALVPSFAGLAAFYQPNPYHRYTADEHTLRVVEALAGFRSADGPLGEIARRRADPAPLILAGLLHDVGKAVDLPRHEVVGADLARGEAERLGLGPEAVDRIGWLVAMHLELNRVAFRRDLHDPATISAFADRMPSASALDDLLLLTCADLMSVAPNVWTDWKQSLLLELHARAGEALAARAAGRSFEQVHVEQSARDIAHAAVALQQSFSGEAVADHLAGPWPLESSAYVATFSPAEIGEHMAAVRRIATAADPASVEVTHRLHAAHAEATIFACDRPGLLALVCAALAAADLNIHDARIFTRSGVVIGRFRLTDSRRSEEAPDAESLERAEADLQHLLAGRVTAETLFERQRKRYRRRREASATEPHGRVEVRFEPRAQHTILDVIAPDRPGLLYRITRSLADLGLNIRQARIATRHVGVLDAFDVVGPTGGPLSSADERRVREGLLGALAESGGRPA